MRKLLAYLGSGSLIVTAFVAIVAFAGLRPVVEFEHKALAGQVKQNREDFLKSELRWLRQQRIQTYYAIEEAKEKGVLVPDWLKKDQADIENQIEEMERELDKCCSE